MQSSFLGSLKKRVEDVLNCLTDLNANIRNYTLSGKWPTDHSHIMKSSVTLSWYLQWYSVPSPLDIKRAAEKIKSAQTSSSVPLLRLVFPTTHVAAIDVINTFLSSFLVEGWSQTRSTNWISSLSSLLCCDWASVLLWWNQTMFSYWGTQQQALMLNFMLYERLNDIHL